MVCIMNKNNNYVNLNIELPKPVVHAIGLLESAGFEAWVVGGAVRDAMLIAGMQAENPETAAQDHAEEGPSDWDLTTDASPDEMLQVFAGERVIETGLKHGTLTVLLDGMPLEITTYRVDGTYTDNRRPDSVSFTKNIDEDLVRRVSRSMPWRTTRSAVSMILTAAAATWRPGFCVPSARRAFPVSL